METVRVVMINLLVMIFFTTVLDLLLPEGSLRSYLKMTMGFFVMLTLLQPVLQLADPDNMAQKWQLSVPTVAGADNAAVQGDGAALSTEATGADFFPVVVEYRFGAVSGSLCGGRAVSEKSHSADSPWGRSGFPAYCAGIERILWIGSGTDYRGDKGGRLE